MVEQKNVKTIKVKHLLSIILLTVIVGAIIFGFLYFRGEKPLESMAPVLVNSVPKYLYSFYEGENKLVRPLGVAVDKNGMIYISNNSVHTVEVLSPNGKGKGKIGGQGNLPGELLYPYGIGLLPDGNLLVTETGNFRIQELTPEGKYVRTFIGPKNSLGLEKPGPIWVDSKGNIYIGDISGSQVLVLDQKCRLLRKIRNISYPHGIAVDEKNRKLYISDAGEVKVKVFSLDNRDERPLTSIETFTTGMRFAMVRGLAVDNLGRLYVADTIFNTIRVFDKDGNYLFSFGQQGFGDGEFLYPNQIFADKSGKVYISDWGKNRIQVWGY